MPSNELIQRRLKVIELADKGMTNKEIANELGISTSTVSSDKKAYHNNPNAYKKTVKKTTATTSKPSKPANKQTTKQTTTDSTANNAVNASTANKTVKTTDKTVKTAHDDAVSTTADNDKTLPAVNTDTTKTDGTAKIKETATTNTTSENTASNAGNNSNSSNADNVDIDSNSSISGDDIVNDVNNMMDKAIHDFQGKLHNIAVEARKEMGLPTDTAPEYGNESPSDSSQSNADNANITPVNTESDGNSDNVSNANSANNASANTSTSRLVKSHVVNPDNIITNSGIITGINNSSQHSYDHSIIANMIGSNDTNAYNVFKNLNDREKWDAKEQEKSNSYVRGFLTGGFIIAIIGIILNILF